LSLSGGLEVVRTDGKDMIKQAVIAILPQKYNKNYYLGQSQFFVQFPDKSVYSLTHSCNILPYVTVQNQEKQFHFYTTQNKKLLLLARVTVNYKPQNRKKCNLSASIQVRDLCLKTCHIYTRVLGKVTVEGCCLRLIRVAVFRRVYKPVKSYH
jgi:hypothetical protein